MLTVYECIDKPLIADSGKEIERGFRGIITPIGLVIFGTQIGNILENSGAGNAMGAVIKAAPIVDMPFVQILTFMAIGSGAMIVSLVNVFYFWIVSHFSKSSFTTAYRAETLAILVDGIAGIVMVFILEFILL
ncbi:hypothetical protein BBR01nite_42940 [Brevibacillus brevis]|nr:hypothetical protein BBR01nite_42940 [Brevibacillus brevis]